MEIALVIPIYKPTEKVLPFLKKIDPKAFCRIFVVDDGSGEKYSGLFDEIRKLPNFMVISYPKNLGKGHALKTAFGFIRDHGPEIQGVVTADGDGQHAYADILAVRDALIADPSFLVLGVRDFKGKNVPWHNKIGNHFSAAYFFLATGIHLKDTQTGLRGIPSLLFPKVIETAGERYEFEMNFLLDSAKETKIKQIPIKTIYEGNKGSHFRPVRDSLRIYKVPLLYCLVALTSWAIDEGLFTLFAALEPDDPFYKILVATVGARLISGVFNFAMEYLVIFKSKGLFSQKFLRYVVVFFINMGLSFGLTYAFSSLPANLTVIKIGVDFVLFVINFFVARGFVFAKKIHSRKNGAAEIASKEARK
jgi:glycosyltransferase involved in cell wall biosynthesis